MAGEELKNIYAGLASKHRSELAALRKKQFVISILRLVTFLAGGILSAMAFTWSVPAGITLILMTMILFLFLVGRFAAYSENIKMAGNLLDINVNEIKAQEGDYSAFNDGSDLGVAEHDFSGDIDLFGEGSVFGFLNRTVTGPGRQHLAGVLLDPYKLHDRITSRQEAVIELSGKLLWRQKFAACGLEANLGEAELRSLNEWLNDKEELFSSQILRVVLFLFPIAAIAALVCAVAGILPVRVFVVFFMLNLFLDGIFLKRINRIHQLVSNRHMFLSALEKLIETVGGESFDSQLLSGIKDKLCTDDGAVARKIKKLGAILKAFDTRLNMIMGVVLNGLVLWDFHCVLRLGEWRTSAAPELPGWLELLGDIDELCSFANFAFNNPDYSFPVPVSEGPVLEASALGHPLLPAATRVCNDFSIEPGGQVCIITGANMSGKSTFLRTIAVNLLLAMAGAPVCARSMRFRAVRLFTSMRTTDSLSRNESYFYAELKRLRILKEKLEKGEEVFFILDEILKGTNSADKSAGSLIYLRRMVELGGTGLIATHDTSLGDMESGFPGKVINKCFEIEIDGEKISFDYLLRNGITRKMNASLLMRQMGIA
jgi:hypothetical protein